MDTVHTDCTVSHSNVLSSRRLMISGWSAPPSGGVLTTISEEEDGPRRAVSPSSSMDEGPPRGVTAVASPRVETFARRRACPRGGRGVRPAIIPPGCYSRTTLREFWRQPGAFGLERRRPVNARASGSGGRQTGQSHIIFSLTPFSLGVSKNGPLARALASRSRAATHARRREDALRPSDEG